MYDPLVISRHLTTPRRRIGVLGALVCLCLFAWWAVQPVGPACPEGLTLSSDPWSSTYDPADAVTGSGDIEDGGTYVPREGDAPSPGTGVVTPPGTSSTFGSGGDDPCGAETRHPRLFGWVGL